MIPEGPVLRFAVSSTELLYERAMARFYKAVEYEQTENARKRSFSVDEESRRRSFSIDQDSKRLPIQADPQEVALTHARINSLSESEKKSVLRRRLSGDNPNLTITIPKRSSFSRDEDDEYDPTYMNTIRNEINTPDMYKNEDLPKADSFDEDAKYSSDYTPSTASSDDEYEDASERRSRSKEKDTYHTRMLSPYRQPQKNEAAEVLTKLKSPLPDPNFVPKPILKRPQSADGRKPVPFFEKLDIFKRRSLSPSPPSNRVHRKSVEIDEKPVIIGGNNEQKDEKSSPKEVPKINVEEPPLPQTPQNRPLPIIAIPEPPPKEPTPPDEPDFVPDPELLKRAEETKKKLLEKRQSSIEENKVMADFYGDIIKTHSLPAKPKVPIYMDPDAIKKLQMSDEEEENQNDSGVTSPSEMSPQSTLNRPFSPNQQNRSQSPFSRRSSEAGKASTLPTDIAKQRRASEAAKVNGKPEQQFSNLPMKSMDTFTPSYNRLELNKSPSPQTKSVYKQAEQSLQSTTENEISSTDELSRGRHPTKSPTGTIPKQRRRQSKSRSRDSSMIRMANEVQPSILKSTVELPQPTTSTVTRRVKSSSRTRNRSESKSPSAMNRKIIINRVAPPVIRREATPLSSQSPLSSRTATPSELQEQVDAKVKSTMTHATDVSILIFATYVYFFKSAMLALPILILLIYRQVASKIPDWMKRKKNS